MALGPSPSRKHEGIFSDISCGNLAKVLEIRLTMSWGPFSLDLPKLLALGTVHSERLAIHQSQPGGLVLPGSRSPLSVSSLGRGSLPEDLLPLRDPGRVADFSVVLLCTCC